MRKKTIIYLLAFAFVLAFAGQASAATLGMDVSRWQGTIDWDTARNYVDFAIIKAGGADEGFYTDGEFSRNRDEARRVGIPRGYYYYAGGGDPIKEAEHFAAIMGKLEPGEIAVLDFELGHPDPGAYAQRFLSRTEQLQSVKPLLYTNMKRVWNLDWTKVVDNGNQLWGAVHDDNPDLIPPASAWSKVTIKQFTIQGIVPGISRNVDLDIFAGSVAEFQALGQPAANAPEALENLATRQPIVHAGGLYDQPAGKTEDGTAASTGERSREQSAARSRSVAGRQDADQTETNIDATSNEQELTLRIRETGLLEKLIKASVSLYSLIQQTP